MYIVDPDTPTDRIEKLNEAVGSLIEKEGGEVVYINNLGQRDLAYPIQKKNVGHYVLFEINGTGQEILELERRMRVNDMIMRYITVRVDEDRKTATKRREKREARAAKRASFRPSPEAEIEETPVAEA